MASKVLSQQLITERFTQQKSGTKSKTVGKAAQSSAQAKHEACEADAEAERADHLVRKEQLDTLRQFDLDWRFGPCTGITRLERWERAERHGHNPPQNIKDLILEHEDDEEYIQNIWSGYPL